MDLREQPYLVLRLGGSWDRWPVSCWSEIPWCDSTRPFRNLTAALLQWLLRSGMGGKLRKRQSEKEQRAGKRARRRKFAGGWRKRRTVRSSSSERKASSYRNREFEYTYVPLCKGR